MCDKEKIVLKILNDFGNFKNANQEFSEIQLKVIYKAMNFYLEMQRNELVALLNIRKYSNDVVSEIATTYENTALFALSHKSTRTDLKNELEKIREKWKIQY